MCEWEEEEQQLLHDVSRVHREVVLQLSRTKTHDGQQKRGGKRTDFSDLGHNNLHDDDDDGGADAQDSEFPGHRLTHKSRH